MNSTSIEHVDVLIIGAGISGIGAACYLQKMQPGKTFAILEARNEIGGTWDLFRYPGIRSDSDLHTFSYEFKAWENQKAIASADAIMAYLRETVAENRIGKAIRLGHKVISASWSTANARWLVQIERLDTGEQIAISCGWFFCASGYYRYDEGYTPEFPGGSGLPARSCTHSAGRNAWTTVASGWSSSVAARPRSHWCRPWPTPPDT